LEWLAWDTHVYDRAVSAGYAREVLRVDPSNAMAVAFVMESAPPKHRDAAFDLAQRGIAALPALRPPAAMGAVEFYRVQQNVTAILCAAVGNLALERKDYPTAREYLRRAVSIAPNDARYAYALGLADLSGKDGNASEGYLQMARAVKLAGQTAQARSIDEYARQRYQEDGGSSADWNRFLAAAITPGNPAPPVIATAPSPTAPRPGVGPKASTASASRLPRPSELPPGKIAESDISDPGLPGPDAAHRQPFRAGAPLSLGILIEASLAKKESRKVLENALGDLVRHLTANAQSEAFVLSFGKNVVFNEDLTGDFRALEKAMDRIKPTEGAALIDAVGVAAFQLNRVSREGNNRVLLVISDGQNLDSKMSPLNATSQLTTGAVRVYCIGVGALGADGGRRLQTLASQTGGDATFVSDPAQIRGATQQIASKFGVEFPY
jgi:hypothetical protein